MNPFVGDWVAARAALDLTIDKFPRPANTSIPNPLYLHQHRNRLFLQLIQELPKQLYGVIRPA